MKRTSHMCRAKASWQLPSLCKAYTKWSNRMRVTDDLSGGAPEESESILVAKVQMYGWKIAIFIAWEDALQLYFRACKTCVTESECAMKGVKRYS